MCIFVSLYFLFYIYISYILYISYMPPTCHLFTGGHLLRAPAADSHSSVSVPGREGEGPGLLTFIEVFIADVSVPPSKRHFRLVLVRQYLIAVQLTGGAEGEVMLNNIHVYVCICMYMYMYNVHNILYYISRYLSLSLSLYYKSNNYKILFYNLFDYLLLMY
jgi:hypothetical protein